MIEQIFSSIESVNDNIAEMREHMDQMLKDYEIISAFMEELR